MMTLLQFHSKFNPTFTMDMVNMKPTKNGNKKKENNKLKVVYISSPMKVKTSASRFRALVQELTGRDSDISQYDASCFDPVAQTTSTNGGPVDGYVNQKPIEFAQQELFTGSESFLDDVLSSELVDKLNGMSPSYSLYGSC